jgi:hypothetical protein
MKRKGFHKNEGIVKHELPARPPHEPNSGETERHLREANIVKMEPILAGTGYWGRAEGEFANAISDEKDPKIKKEMTRRYEELALQLKDLDRDEREQVLLEQLTKWKKKRRV